jgi:hypothetical protein
VVYPNHVHVSSALDDTILNIFFTYPVSAVSSNERGGCIQVHISASLIFSIPLFNRLLALMRSARRIDQAQYLMKILSTAYHSFVSYGGISSPRRGDRDAPSFSRRRGFPDGQFCRPRMVRLWYLLFPDSKGAHTITLNFVTRRLSMINLSSP